MMYEEATVSLEQHFSDFEISFTLTYTCQN